MRRVRSMRLLLLSNSTGPDGTYLGWCGATFIDFLARGSRVLFVPFAGIDEEGYGRLAVARLGELGFEAAWFDRSADDVEAIARFDAVFIGGGNTFLLLDRLHATGLLDAVTDAVRAGVPYVGASAGTNVAGPTIMTTNDMPIVRPPTFDSMGLVGFQINPHYLDPDPDSKHMGETRDQRLLEFHEENEIPVVALREGAMLAIQGQEVTVEGRSGARIFLRNRQPQDCPQGTRVDLEIS